MHRVFNEREIILQYIALFGDRKPSEFGITQAYLCPNCKGVGFIYQQSSDGRSDSNSICKYCNGVGYTEKELKPKMVQSGWE